MLTARGRWRITHIVWAAGLIFGLMHLIAWALLQDKLAEPIGLNLSVLIVLTSSLLLTICMMLSQALESVTRLFYSRGDLDLVLTSPVPTERFFLPRLSAVAVGCWLTTLPVAAPFIHVLAIIDTPWWLAAHLVMPALAGLATGIAVWLAFGLFGLFGPQKTRLIAQIVAAIIGATFVIGLQLAAILQTQSLARFDVLLSAQFVNSVPAMGHWSWLPATALMGDIRGLVLLFGLNLVLWWLTVVYLAPRLAKLVTAAQSQTVSHRHQHANVQFLVAKPKAVLRRKEWQLLMRDPWLVSQSLMQILYLLPPAALLFLHYGGGGKAAMALGVAILTMAMGQLAGGLAWLALSGEDAKELMITAPIKPELITRAKIEAVLAVIAIVTAPILLGMAVLAPMIALMAGLGIGTAAMSTVFIQIWFQGDASRRQFRRRQTTSRIAAFAEALVCIGWAAAFSVAAQLPLVGLLLAIFPLGLMLLVRQVSRPAKASALANASKIPMAVKP